MTSLLHDLLTTPVPLWHLYVVYGLLMLVVLVLHIKLNKARENVRWLHRVNKKLLAATDFANENMRSDSPEVNEQFTQLILEIKDAANKTA